MGRGHGLATATATVKGPLPQPGGERPPTVVLSRGCPSALSVDLSRVRQEQQPLQDRPDEEFGSPARDLRATLLADDAAADAREDHRAEMGKRCKATSARIGTWVSHGEPTTQ